MSSPGVSSTGLDRRPAIQALQLARATVGGAAIVGLLAAAVALAIGTAGTRRRYLLPASRHAYPEWLAGPLHGLGVVIEPRTGALLVVAMAGCYLVAALTASALPSRVVWGGVVGAHVAMLLAPPIFSADVFGYISYARLFVEHGVDPYLRGAAAVPLDAARPFVVWRDIATPYGPVFTTLSLPLGWLSVPAALWACKAMAAAGSLICVWLVGRIAVERGSDPVPAVAFFGLNPLLLVYEVGGAHNDMLPVALMLLAVLFVVRGRAAAGGLSVALAAGAKASAALLMPFALLAARPRREAVAGAAAGLVAVVVVGLLVFGVDSLSIAHQLRQQQEFVAHYSVPSRLSSLVGHNYDIPHAVRVIASVSFVVAVAGLLLAVWRRWLDWISGAAWATLALLLASAWLVPWYAVWLLPLTALSRSRLLLMATLLFCGYVVTTQVYWLL
jgi:alpha-1,6-mannosyltransferase